MDVSSFLHAVITTESGFLCTPVSDGTHWVEAWHRWPEEEAEVLSMVEETKSKLNVHFSSYLFRESTSDKHNALPSRTIQADLDNADINSLPIQPTVLVQTSPGRYHGYWILDKELPAEQHEQLSRRLTYSIPLCDRSGWPIAKKLRIADTFNYKYDVPHEVQVVRSNDLLLPVSKFELLQPAPNSHEAHTAEEWLELSEHGYQTGPHELLASIKQQIPAAVYNQYDSAQTDRSGALWALMCAAFRAGLSQDGVFWLAKHSANNKFAHLKYGADRELAKDVLRAYDSVKAGIVNLRQFMNNARHQPGTRSEKMQYLLECTKSSLQESGTFSQSTNGQLWYLDRTTGRPIELSTRSDQLDSLLDLRYALNPTEQEQRYIAAGLVSHASGLPPTSVTTSLSYFNETAKALYVHTGRKDVIRIRPGGIDSIPNGEDEVIFPWAANQDLFVPNYEPFSDMPWYEMLFRESVGNIVSMPQDQAVTLLRVWLLFLLFRHAAISRPILAVFGNPGSGKSTLFRKVYGLLYGSNRSIGAVTNSDNFDYSCANDAFVVLDNVDTFERWLPDRLALSASTSDITKRKLYTDSDVVTLRRQALIGLTAHAPKFGREDVADRLLLINLERLDEFEAEGAIIRRVLDNRSQLWGNILLDCQKVISNPYPNHAYVPQFRVEDFARLGYWIAQGIGETESFVQALNTIKVGQHAFSLDEDSLIVSTVLTFVQKSQHAGKYHNLGQLWTYLETYSGDPLSFKKNYHNAQDLGKKLWVLQDSLKEVISIDHKVDPVKGSRSWCLGALNVSE